MPPRPHRHLFVLLLASITFTQPTRGVAQFETPIGSLSIGASIDYVPHQAWAAGNTILNEICIVPFFVDNVFHGCILNTSSATHFARDGAYSNAVLRSLISGQLSEVGALPNPISDHLSSILHEVQSRMIGWLVQHIVATPYITHVNRQRNAATKPLWSYERSTPSGGNMRRKAVVIDYNPPRGMTLRLIPGIDIVVAPEFRSIFAAGFNFKLVLPSHTFRWASFWEVNSHSVDAAVHDYCIKSGMETLARDNLSDGFKHFIETLAHVLSAADGSTSKSEDMNPIEIVLGYANSLVNEYKHWCMMYAGNEIIKHLWDLRQLRVQKEISMECNQQGDSLVRSFPIRQDLIAVPPVVVQGKAFGSALRLLENDGVPGALAMLYEGEMPEYVAAELCQLIGPQRMADSAGGFSCEAKIDYACCTSHTKRALAAYASCTRNKTGNGSAPCFGANDMLMTVFQPRAYLHVCRYDVGFGARHHLTDTALNLTPGTRRFCARMYVEAGEQHICQRTVLSSLDELFKDLQKTNPRYVNRSGEFYNGTGVLKSRQVAAPSVRNSSFCAERLCPNRENWDIVVSRCRESILWLARLVHEIPSNINIRIQVYDKCDDKKLHIKELKRSLQETSSEERVAYIESKILPNIGFEAHTYLYHILHLFENEKRQLDQEDSPYKETVTNGNWSLFPDHVFFLQGNPFDHLVSEQQRENFFAYIRELPFHPLTQDYAGLSDLYSVEPTLSFYCFVHDALFRGIATKADMETARLPRTRRKECTGTLGYFALSQFFASRRAIKRRPVSFYKYAMDLVVGAHNYSWTGNGKAESECSESCFLVGYEWTKNVQKYINHYSPSWTRDFASGKFMTEAFERMWHIIFGPDDASLFQARRPQLSTIVPAPQAGPPHYLAGNPRVFFAGLRFHSTQHPSNMSAVKNELMSNEDLETKNKIARLIIRSDLETFRKLNEKKKPKTSVLANTCVILTGTVLPHRDVSLLSVLDPLLRERQYLSSLLVWKDSSMTVAFVENSHSDIALLRDIFHDPAHNHTVHQFPQDKVSGNKGWAERDSIFKFLSTMPTNFKGCTHVMKVTGRYTPQRNIMEAALMACDHNVDIIVQNKGHITDDDDPFVHSMIFGFKKGGRFERLYEAWDDVTTIEALLDEHVSRCIEELCPDVCVLPDIPLAHEVRMGGYGYFVKSL